MVCNRYVWRVHEYSMIKDFPKASRLTAGLHIRKGYCRREISIIIILKSLVTPPFMTFSCRLMSSFPYESFEGYRLRWLVTAEIKSRKETSYNAFHTVIILVGWSISCL